MSIETLLATLAANDIQLAVKDGQLAVQGNRQALGDPQLVAQLRVHKAELLALIARGEYQPERRGAVQVPVNGIIEGCTHITPAMLTLAELDQPGIDRLLDAIPGGAANVQDIYPLTPLQQGILYHHASATDSDPYVMRSQFAFADRQRLETFAEALRGVIARHDILRTSVHWEGFEQPLQVVWRQAELQLDEGPEASWIDLTQAPLIRLNYRTTPDSPRILASLQFHHIALDHSALEVVRHEMRALLQGEGAMLGEPVPFRNYVAQACLGVSQAQHEAFFEQMLGDVHEPTLAYQLPGTLADDAESAEHSLDLDAALCLRVRAQARAQGVSVASLFHLGWARVLGALSGRDDVVFGTVLMGRLQGAEATERALGIFINTLPLRVGLAGQTAAEALKATHQRLATLMRHEHAPLALAQRCSAVAAPAPLFNSLLNYRHSVAEAGEQARAAWNGIEVLHSQERSNYPLTLSVDDLGEALRLTLLAGPQVPAARVCAYVREAMLALLEALEQGGQASVAGLPVLPSAEREWLLEGFNAQHHAHDLQTPLGQWVADQARQRPEAIAAQCQGEVLDYATLDRRANALAHRLIELGVVPEARVAVLARRGLDTLVGLLAVLKAGGGYVPIDPAHPDERIAYLLADSAPQVVLTQQSLRARLDTVHVPVLTLDAPDWPAQEQAPVVPGLTPSSLAYVIYTSGSTGLPKGVMVEHRTLANLVGWHCRAFDLGPDRQTSSLAGFGFDAMAWELWPALCSGATLHLAPPGDGNDDLDALLQWWQAQPLDVSFLPTPVAEYAFSQQLQHPTLRTLLIGGDRLRQFNRNLSFSVVNNYGPTETTVVASSGVVQAGGPLHIGAPVDNARLYVLDAQQQPVPLGVAGELYIGGAGVARGYLGRPAMTAERFLDDPFAEGRMYRSGDLVRWLADGTLEYLGRNDDQVKIRGMRIELGEIESRLNSLPGIAEAVVVAREDQPGQPRLVAYFTTQPDIEVAAPERLRAQLQAHLPDYMVPVAFVGLAALPLTANGKLDRRALPKPEREALFERAYEAPQGELEHSLAQIWSELLHVPQVGRRDHFFELGGHSLLAMRMVSQVRLRLGVELPLTALFANAELAGVAEYLASAEVCALPPILPQPAQQALPLSFAQQRLWFLAQLGDAGQAYHIPLALGLRGALNVQALEGALLCSLDRHQTLRSRFVAEGEQAQVHLQPTPQPGWLQREDLRQAPQYLAARLSALAAEPFDLAGGLPLRASLLQLADDHHVLALTVHHIVADGGSLAVLTAELSQLYPALRQGLANPLPALAVQYGDYAVWQRRWLEGERLRQQADYWQRNLAGAPALLTLPWDRPRPARQDFAGANLAIRLDARLSAGLRALALRHGATLYTVLLSAWASLLARLAGQPEVVIGCPVAGRDRAELEGLVGLFVNTLALRIGTQAASTAEALLGQVRERLLEAQAHQTLPFEQVVEVVRPARSLAHTPLFQTTLNWLPGSLGELSLEGLWLEPVVQAGQVAKFDLSLNLGEQGDCVVGALEYASALFDEGTVRRFAGYFERLLQAMVANDQADLAQVELLGDEERQRLLVAFNATATAFDLEQTVHGLIEAQVRRSPEAIAVRSEAGTLSFAQLNAQANRLAHHLIELGVKPDDRVAICVERGLSMVVGLLAILKAGGAYVPVDPDYPAERITHMLTDSEPVAVLVHGATRHVPQGMAAPLVDLDSDSWAHLSEANPQIQGLTPNHLAYVIYTSGSTGLPKGVMNEHRGVVNRLLWTQQAYGLTAEDVVLQKTPFSFDVSVWEFFWPLQTGASLLMARPGGHKDPAYLRQVIADEQVTTLHFVPSMLDAFLAFGDVAPAAMRRVLCSGEALPGSLVRRFKAQLPSVELHNLYGPTEAAVDVSAWHCIEVPDNTPIGRPVANTALYVLDAYGQPVPQGVAGELYIGGVQVARGYLNRAELSAERFLDDPFNPGGRLYRTGDLARYLGDGNLEYLGRNDDQVKIRGLRIELGEIQACLTRLDGIQEAAVLAPEVQPGDRRLVAYYTGQAQPVETLRAALLRQLPEFMVPALFVWLDALPLSPNGKLDRKALPVPGSDALTTRPYEAPQGATETLLAEVWAELLGVERVGRHDNFFELGGHSLLAVSLVARLRSRGLVADIHVLFDQPILAALAATLVAAAAPSVPANRIAAGCQRITPELLPLVALDQPAIERVVQDVAGGAANVQDIYPLGPLQAGILYHYLANPEEADPYLLQARFAFSDEARLKAFANALQQAIDRHDSLRSALHWDGLATPVQVVRRAATLPVQAVATLDAPEHQRLDLTQAPLLRLLHTREPGTDRIVASLRFHHVVMDHVALEVLVQELQALLLGEGEGLPAPVPYRNYIAQCVQGHDAQADEAYFREQLGDIDEPTLPYGQQLPHGVDTPRQAQRVLEHALCQAVREQARAAGVSAASLMHLAWALVLGQLSGRDSVVFGSVLLGRLAGGEGSERALGVYINSLPLRIDLAGCEVAQALRTTHQRLSELLRHEHAQLALALRCSGLPAGAPLFSALLNYRHGAAPSADGRARMAWQGIELLQAEERSNYPLAMSIDDHGEGFTLTAQSAEGIDAQRVCGYLQHALQVLLQALRQAPQTPLTALSILPAAERARVLDTFNATARDYPRDLPVHRLFEQQVARQPQAVAAVQGERSLSYAALNERANRLAHYLISQGVQPGQAVAILLPRSLELLVAQLAVAKCAAVYVPLDIHAPAERQAYMLDDCQAVMLLCRSDCTLAHATPRVILERLALHEQAAHNPGLAQGGDSAAYVMYTSGSSGAPKGVQIAHRGIARLALNNGYADFDARDRFAFAANPAFDASTVEVWAALLNGAQLQVIDQQTLLDPEQLAHALGGVSVLFLTTALFNQYVPRIPQALAGLRILMCGGERGEPEAFRQLLAQAPNLRLVHCYGPTESTSYATTSEVRALPLGAESVPIGRPIGNTQVYVLDPHLRPLPEGVVGELYIGGDGLALGYLNRAQLSAERFIDSPFNGARLYRTGDLGYWREDGQLECLGRNDDQVKIRGFRIELGEIEQQMAACPGIGDVVVQALAVDQGPLRLLGWFSRRDPALDAARLRQWLQARLPEYMVPVALVGLDSLPLNNNGKVDRKALPVPALGALDQADYQAPASALEQQLAQVWAQVLEVAQVGRHDSFFALGGHSLSAIRVVDRLRQAGVTTTLAQLFQHPSVAALAQAVADQAAAVDFPGLVTVRGEGSEPALFLIHEFSGLDVYFPVLGRHLPGDFPIYGLPGIALGQPTLQTMECLASRAIECIRAAQPQGPYRLAGWSFGGVLAYEIAAQLRGMDEAVSFLGLIDTFLPRLTDQGKARWEGPGLLQRHLLLHCTQHWQAQGAAGLVQLAKLQVLEQQGLAFEALLAACRAQQLLYAALMEAGDDELRHFLVRELAHGHALAHYRVEPTALPVHLFCAAQRSAASPAEGWRATLSPAQVLSVEVPGDHLSMMQAPHVQALGRALGEALALSAAQPVAAHQPLVAIQSGQAGFAPLFCVPGAGDSVTRFVGLADALGTDWPVYGLQPRGLDGAGEPHRRVEAAAACHVLAIQALYPQGPLHLVGHSFGGWIAHAMACQLQVAGREVASLTLIDSEAPAGSGVCGKPYTTTAALQRLIESLQLGSGKALAIDASAFAAADDDQQLRSLHTAMQQAGLLPLQAGMQALAGSVRTFSAALRTLYHPQGVYHGPVSLVLVADPTLDAAGSQREQAAMHAGWQRLLPQLTLWQGPGNHFSVLKAPQVFSLAAWWHDGQARVHSMTP